FRCAFGNTAGSKADRFNSWCIRQRRNHDTASRRDLARRCGLFGARSNQLFDRTLGSIVDDDSITGIQHVPGHGLAHLAEADDADTLHEMVLLYSLMASRILPTTAGSDSGKCSRTLW